MEATVEKIISFISTTSSVGKFAILSLVTALEYVFPVLPGDTIMVLAGLLTARGALDLIQAFLAVAVGSAFGGAAAFFFGRYLISAQAKHPRLEKLLPTEKVAVFQRWYARWGYPLMLVSRFIPAMRAVFFAAAGLSGLPLLPILALGVLSSLLFNACLLYLGRAVGRRAEDLAHLWHSYGFPIDIFILIAILAVIFIFLFIKLRPPH